MSSKNVVDLRKSQRKPVPPRALSARTVRRVAVPPAAKKTFVAASVHRSASERHSSPLRQKRRRIRIITLVVLVVFLLVGVFGLSYASYLPRYTVHTVTIEGAQEVPASSVNQFIESQLSTSTRSFFSPNNVLLFKAHALESEIAGFFPRIKSVTVSRSSLLATAITVTIKERQRFALWCPRSDIAITPGMDCYSMDETGFIFAQADGESVEGIGATATSSASSSAAFPASFPAVVKVFSGGLSAQDRDIASGDASTTIDSNGPTMGSVMAPEPDLSVVNPIGHMFAPAHFPGILAFMDQLGHIGLGPIGAVVDNADGDFIISLREGFAIKASFGQDTDSLVRNLQLILSSDALQGKQSDLDYIDLRFGDRTYYKLKGVGAASVQ